MCWWRGQQLPIEKMDSFGSIFPSTRAIIASVPSTQPFISLESQLSDSDYNILESVGNVSLVKNGIQHICTAAVPGWLVTHYS